MVRRRHRVIAGITPMPRGQMAFGTFARSEHGFVWVATD
jgi:hypothetical protein